jgi:hypothetical protein
MRKTTARYTWTGYKPNNSTLFLVRIQEYKRNCLQHTNRMPLNNLPRIIRTRDQPVEETRGEHERDFLTCETGVDQQVANLHVG